METAVSVIIPVYNCEKTVGRCINSVLNQTLANIEVIAVNDGSDDSTLKVLKGINDDRLKIISHLNYGQGYEEITECLLQTVNILHLLTLTTQ